MTAAYSPNTNQWQFIIYKSSTQQGYTYRHVQPAKQSATARLILESYVLFWELHFRADELTGGESGVRKARKPWKQNLKHEIQWCCLCWRNSMKQVRILFSRWIELSVKGIFSTSVEEIGLSWRKQTQITDQEHLSKEKINTCFTLLGKAIKSLTL